MLFKKSKKPFRLSDFSEEDVAFLKKRLVEIVKGVIYATAEEKVDEIIDQLYPHEFYTDTEAKMDFPVTLSGDTLLAFLGTSKRRRVVEQKPFTGELNFVHRSDGTVFVYPTHEHARWARTIVDNLSVEEVKGLVTWWLTKGIAVHGVETGLSKAGALEHAMKK